MRAYLTIRDGKLEVWSDGSDRLLASFEPDASAAEIAAIFRQHGIDSTIGSSSMDFPVENGGTTQQVDRIQEAFDLLSAAQHDADCRCCAAPPRRRISRPIEFKVQSTSVDGPVLPTSAGSFYLYAVHPTLGAAYLQTGYRHTVTAEYTTRIVRWNQTEADTRGGHPRTHGVTVKQGWAIRDGQ